MVGVDLEDLLEVGEGVVVAVGVEHLRLLDLVHEAAVAVGIGDHHAGLGGESVRDDHVVHLLEQDLLGVFDEGLVFLCKEFLHFSLTFSVVRHLEVSLADVDDVLSFVLSEVVEDIFVNGVIAE